MSEHIGGIEYVLVECANCSIPFYMTKHLNQERRKDHRTFYCPVGHNNYYPQKSNEERLQEQLDSARRSYASLSNSYTAVERSLKATKGHLTRAKNELQKGNCPNCDEHFDDLEQHIKAKHPNFDLEPVAEESVKKRPRGRPRKHAVKEKVLTKA